MIKDILNSYQFRGRLQRIPFALAFAAIAISLGYAAYEIRRSLYVGGDGGESYLLVAWGAEILIALLVFPLCAARLRDIGWSAYLSILILFLPFFSVKFAIIAALNAGGFMSSSYWFSGFNLIGSIVMIAFVAALALVKGANWGES